MRSVLYRFGGIVWQRGAEVFPFTTNTVSAPRLGKVGAKNVLSPLLNIQSKKGGLLHGTNNNLNRQDRFRIARNAEILYDKIKTNRERRATMYSVTQRIKVIKQPRGGYIKPKEFSVTVLDDGIQLHTDENIHASLIGLAVDYLTRYMMGTPVNEAFQISLLGAERVRESDYAQKLLKKIKGLDDLSISNSCKLVGYDVCFRAGLMGYRPVQEISPNNETIENIRTMVNRCLDFWKEYGPIVLDGFTFEGGYTNTVSTGDGDYLTNDTLWDFKVSKEAPKNQYTLQLLMYYIMGCHSIHKEFQTIKRLGIYNPRLNTVYLLNISDISKDIIKEVSTEVIGY